MPVEPSHGLLAVAIPDDAEERLKAHLTPLDNWSLMGKYISEVTKEVGKDTSFVDELGIDDCRCVDQRCLELTNGVGKLVVSGVTGYPQNSPFRTTGTSSCTRTIKFELVVIQTLAVIFISCVIVFILS